MDIDKLTEQILEITNNSDYGWIDLDSADANRIRVTLTKALTIPVVINWVAVSDRLPDHLQKVIMYGKQTEYSKYEQITGVLNRAGGLNQWNTYGIIMHEVTYWTPALEPPCL